jgi:hypothetical protein
MSGVTWNSGEWAPEHLVGLNDPYTLTPLAPGERIEYCTNCHLGYHLATVAMLREGNRGACVGCMQPGRWRVFILPGGDGLVTELPAVAPVASDTLVRLDKIWDYVGHIVTFEGFVHRVQQSRSSATWFVVFEPKRNPLEAFRLVIYNRYSKNWLDEGIDINSYSGKVIRVRGLIRVDPNYGIQMLINQPGVITIVDDEKRDAVADSAAPENPPDPYPPANDQVTQRIIWKREHA